MTETEQKALELVNEVLAEWGVMKNAVEVPKNSDAFARALLRAIEKHEVFRQEVSDAVEAAIKHFGKLSWTVGERQENIDTLSRFIIAKPDPLVIEAREICARVCEGWIDIPKDRAAAYRAGSHDDEADFAYVYAALAKRGLEIREKE